jgi:hypothetical protein
VPPSNSSVAVVIPWRPSPGREHNLAPVKAALIAALPGAEVAGFDTGHQPFSRAAARNGGVRNSYAGTNVLVVCDADAIVEPEPLQAAVAAAADGKLHLPYTACRLLTQAGSQAVLAGANPQLADAWYINPYSVGGCVVVAYDTWRDVGGWDERFIGWGFEDTAFWASVDTLHGTVRHDGTLHDLWHPDGRGIGSPQYLTSKALCDRYTAAQGDPTAIRALIEERACASA